MSLPPPKGAVSTKERNFIDQENRWLPGTLHIIANLNPNKTFWNTIQPILGDISRHFFYLDSANGCYEWSIFNQTKYYYFFHPSWKWWSQHLSEYGDLPFGENILINFFFCRAVLNSSISSDENFHTTAMFIPATI